MNLATADLFHAEIARLQAEVARLREAIRRLADQDATLSVCNGNVTVTMDATLTDAEREAMEAAVIVIDARNRVGGPVMFRGPERAATLRGLLERLSDAAALSDAGQSGETGNATPEPQSTPAECSVPPAWTSRPYWVDPPSGHRYGFPRLYNPASDGDMTEWMIRCGYPERLARQGLPCTFTAWTEDGEK